MRGELVGFVFQSFQLLSSLTALENVMLPLELAGKPGPRDQAVQLLGRVGLEARLHHYPKQLSGGEQQRVAIARAVLPSPPFCLPMSQPATWTVLPAERVIDLLFELNQERKGTTLVLVTHDEQLARYVVTA